MNYSEYSVICEALNNLDSIISQEAKDKISSGYVYKLLTNLEKDYQTKKTAEDYFKELCYEKSVFDNLNCIIYFSTTNKWHSIVFYLDTHEVKIIGEENYITLTVDLLTAIQKQIVELGWH